MTVENMLTTVTWNACHNYFTLVFGEDHSKQVQENVFKVQDQEVALQHKHNAENATMA